MSIICSAEKGIFETAIGPFPTSECPFTGPFKKLCKMASGSEKIANLHLRGAYFELGL